MIQQQTVRIPSLSNDENALINGLLAQIENLRWKNLLRTSYYENKRTIQYVGTLIPPQYFNLGLVLGWTGKAVDALARRCNLEGFVWPDGDLDSLGGTEVVDDNHLLSEIDSAIVAAMQHGPAFLINTVGEDDEPEALIHVKDASEATGEWNRRRRGLNNLLSIIDKDKEGKVLSLALYLDNETVTAQRDKATLKWQVDRDEHVYGVPAQVLPYKPAPKRPFGQSRITKPMMGLQDAGVRELARREGHMDVFSYPEFWLLGADESALKNADGTIKSVWEARLGRIKGLPDDADADIPQLARADVKQFPAASPDAHWSDINGLAKLFAREASLPDTAVAISGLSNPTSAESYDASQYELIAEAEGAVDDFTPALRKAFIRALAMKNKVAIDEIPDEWKSIDAKWRDPRYLSKSAQADAGMKQLAAVPWLAETEVGLELIGLTPQQARRAMADKRRVQGRGTLQALIDRSNNGATAQ
ncbi:portal protein [Mycobacterium phage Soul22]|uniref:Portal protein n=2 Tax=Avanivirus TaxID=2843352 RepID=Q855V9_9CAUD|nr:portal protein [Mycobacterium phage Che9d]YP_009963819.1 portal protein [Mycobacterium phage Soul22]AAN07922.1 portal protein [Mycobacterium phage Che9d]QLF84226.1 portal protein [Mycobacterium phage Soul22]QXG07374.1 portal protein [Mycobacterium phage RitSun]